MHKLTDLCVADLELGSVYSARSGANADYIKGHVVQTPWLTVQSIRTYENAKTAVFVQIDEDMHALLDSIEKKAFAQLSSMANVSSDCWRSGLHPSCWKLNVTSQTNQYGEPLIAGSLVAAIVEFVGVWMWNEQAGLKVKTLQIKVPNEKARLSARPDHRMDNMQELVGIPQEDMSLDDKKSS